MSFRPTGISRLTPKLLVSSLAFLLGFGSTAAWSQATSTATVTGLVTDEQNAAVAGAEVRLLEMATGSSQSTLSNETGRYVLVNIQPGTYAVTISKAGFTVFKINAQKVDLGSSLSINATLKVGSTSTTVEVTATVGADLQTTNATVGNTLTSEALMKLPNMGRDAATLAVLQPGVTPSGMTAGAFSDQNVFMLDGGNNSDDMAGNNTSYVTNFTGTGGVQTGGSPSGIIPTPVESIEEFKVGTFNQSADFSGSIGSQVQMATKRGSNAYHGSAYGFYFATNVGAANSWANNHTPSGGLTYTALPSNHRNRFGGSLGGVLLPKLLGGKTYFFVNYEGSRFPNVGTIEKSSPSALLRAGVIQVADASGKYQAYNLNPTAVTVNGVSYQPAQCGTSMCDPRAIGLNPVVQKIWQYMPIPTDFTGAAGDGANTGGYISTIRAPLTTNSYVARIDHDLNEKNRFFATYRYTTLTSLTTNQVDLGGLVGGGTLGQPVATAPRVQKPSFWVLGLTSAISPTVTNDFRWNYSRNYWQWFLTGGNAPQLPGLAGALEIGGETGANGGTNALIPYNVNTQSTRTRYWDGKDNLFKDDVTIIKGNHLIQVGGSYQRNYYEHSRTDNGQGINNTLTYQVTASNINFANFTYPTGVPTNQQTNFNTYYSYVMGFVSQSQLVYTRSGANLALGPIGTSTVAGSIVPAYNSYFADSWHIKPSVTISYGLSYQLEMPPHEGNGKQVMLVDQDGSPVVTADYMAQRQKAALAGSVYNPVLGFSTVNNVGAGRKYPYDPFYGGLAPRFSIAWNPKFNDGILGKLFGSNTTVLRAGYGRLYGRQNGVIQVLTPLLAPGLLQAVSCVGPSRNGAPCASGVDPSTAFRIGPDGMSAPLPVVSPTLSQPYLPGVGGNAGASDVTANDPKYRPERTDNLTLSVQRQINRTVSMEVGYIGRIIRNELMSINLDSVPYMTTLGGQTFANAFAQTYFAVNAGGTPAAQPFFEAALGGTAGASCAGFANCTAAVASKQATAIKNTAVSDLWTALYKAPGWTLGRSMVAQPLPGQTTSQGYTYLESTALGFGNYNALFITHHIRDFHGITATSNFTWGRALGTNTTSQASSSITELDNYNLKNNYGIQPFDVKFVYNITMFYSPKFYSSQKGIVGKLLGGWTVSPLLTAQSGNPIAPTYVEAGSNSGQQAFGEVSTGSSATFSNVTNAPAAASYTGGSNANYNVAGSNGVGTNNPGGVNMLPIRPRYWPSSASACSASTGIVPATPCAPSRGGTSTSASIRRSRPSAKAWESTSASSSPTY